MLKIFKQYYPIRNIFFIFGEACVIFFSVLLSALILMGFDGYLSDSTISYKILLITFICIVCLYYNELYDFKIVTSFKELCFRLLQSIGMAAIVLAGFYYVFPSLVIREGVFIISIIFLLFFIITWRVGYASILKHGYMNQNIILLGSGEMATEIKRIINNNIDCGYTIHVHEIKKNELTYNGKDKSIIYTDYSNLLELCTKLGIQKIVVAISDRRGGYPSDELVKCRVNGIDIIEGDSFFESLTGKVVVEHIKPAWLIFSNGFQKSRLISFLKRFEDIISSAILLTVASPIVLITCLFIKFDSKGPLIFSQERSGKNKKKYRIYKFRSMITDAELESGPVWAKEKDDRVTRVGHFIRKWRIDELPQLYNVIKGDMSLVGPRPEREHFIDQLEKKIPFYSQRFSVKPGLTGWAQVNYGYGANEEDAIEKLNYELFYIKNMSLMMDVVILFRTIKTVIFGTGAR